MAARVVSTLSLNRTLILLSGLAAIVAGDRAFADAGRWEVSAFADFRQEIVQAEPDRARFRVGQLEIGAHAEPNANVSAMGTLAFDSDSESFALGSGFLDLHARSGEASVGVVAGQFDVPFGVDRYSYASVDRQLVSTPLVVEGTHGAWNDVGASLYWESGWGAAQVYSANGFALPVRGDEVPDLDREARLALGGRGSVVAPWGVELGASWARVSARELEGERLDLYGTDLRLERFGIVLVGEYIRQSLSSRGADRVSDHGAYVSLAYRFRELTLLARRDKLSVGIGGNESLHATSLGFEYRIIEGTALRSEYRFGDHGPLDSVVLQLVTSLGG